MRQPCRQCVAHISVSAIDQFEVHYGFFMPDLGPNPGIVDVITKRGMHQFQGEVYGYVRTDQTRARDYFNRITPNPPYNQASSGPASAVLHDKAFFFGNYEGYRQTQSTFTPALVPVAAKFNATSRAAYSHLQSLELQLRNRTARCLRREYSPASFDHLRADRI